MSSKPNSEEHAEKDAFLPDSANHKAANGDNHVLNGKDPESYVLSDAGKFGHGEDVSYSTEGVSSEDQGGEKRHTWSRKAEYILTMMGYCVGLGNVWRFPYVCIRNGGGAFLIPFFICLFVCGLPLFFLEVALGQFLSRGALHVWSICPLFKGIGISMNMTVFICSWYYSMILSWSLIYLANSFKSPLPWMMCGQEWNTDNCALSKGNSSSHMTNTGTDDANTTWAQGQGNLTALGGSNSSGHASVASVKEFWLNNVLELSPGPEHMDGIPWHVAVALLVSSVIAFACIVKGVKSVGKVVYVTATLPYLLLIILIVKGATLPGAVDGVLFYITPDFSKLLTIQPWVEASLQVFYSLGPGWGVLITMASYNKFNNNCLRDAIMLTFVCEGTSIFAGFAIFTILGHMAYTLDVPVANFSSAGPGLAFVVYPEAISYLPVPQLWGVLFFLMLFTIGLDSQFATIETILTTFHDLWPKFVNKWNYYIKVIYACFLFLITLPLAARGGMYLFQMIDWYFAAFTMVANGILECIIVAWIYGGDRLLDDAALMIGKRPSYIFVILWKYCTPVLLAFVLICTLVTYAPPVYEGYVYGEGARVGGWLLAFASFLPVPACAIHMLCTTKGSLKQRLKSACSPSHEWHPADSSLREQYKLHTADSDDPSCTLPCCKV